MCGLMSTFFNSITSFLSSLLSLLLCNSRGSTTTVDIELGGVGPLKVVTKSTSPGPHTVDFLKIRDAMDSPRTSMVVPSSLSGKLTHKLQEFPEEPVTHKIAMPANDPFPRTPSIDSFSDDDRSSDRHSIESSFDSGAADVVEKYQRFSSFVDEQLTRDGTFVEDMEGGLTSQGETEDSSSEVHSPQDEHDGNDHFRQFFSNVDINEVEIEAERSSDEGTSEDDSDVPAHRWLKFAIEFVWLHKLPNTIQELQEMEEEEIAREVRAVKGLASIEETLEEDNRLYAAAFTPEIIEHPPTPPNTGPILDTSLCRVREVTEDLVDLLASLKVTLRDSPTSFRTATASNKSDASHDAPERPAILGVPISDSDDDTLSEEAETSEGYHSSNSESHSQDIHVNPSSDNSFAVCSPGCTRCGRHRPRPSLRLRYAEVNGSP